MNVSSRAILRNKEIIFIASLLVSAAAPLVQAEDITSTFVNADFDASTEAYFANGFDYASVYDVPGWHDLYTDGNGAYDMGIEYEGAWWSPYQEYSGFMSVDDGAYLLSSYVIQEGDLFSFSFVGKSWNNGSSEATVTLFYGNDPTANAIGTFVQGVGGSWVSYTDTAGIPATGGAVGQTLGFSIDNTGASFLCFDECSMDVVHTNEAGATSYTPAIDPVSAGTSVTLSALVSGQPISYTWQTDNMTGGSTWSDLPGSSTNTYVLDTTGLSAGTHQYRLIVTYPSGSYTNTPAEFSIAALMPNHVGGALAGVTNDTVYLMCYHEGYYPAGGNSGVFISWSTNGYDFSQLNDGHPLFIPPEFPGDDYDNGSSLPNLVRDPSIVYAEGLFHMVFTSDIFSRSFGYAESPDLVNWSNVKLVQIWENEPGSVGRTWAPEIFYDDVLDQYMIAFASDVDGGTLRLYYTTTSDFATFTDPVELYYDPSGSWEQIDAFIAKVATGQYMMAYKKDAQTWILDSSSPYGPWSNSRQATAGGDEGPSLLRIGSTWHLYFDNYGNGDNVFGMAISTDTTNWTDVTGLTDMPTKADVPDYGYDGGPPHHCTVFAAPLSALGAFTQPLQDNVTNLSSLVYRWSFDEAGGSASSGTTVTDSVSGAEAIVVGNGASFTGSALELPGTSDGTGNSAYIDLPNGIVSSLTNLTLEIWATPVSSKTWQRLFSFGRTVETGDGGGEWSGPASGSTSAQQAMYWTINNGNDINKQDCAMMDDTDTNKDALTGTCLDTTVGTRYHYVFTFEAGIGFFGATGGRMTLYRDGFQIGWRDVPFQLKDLDDINNWLGRSQWSGDWNSNVAYDEVRIYSSALSWYDIYGHYLAGPDVLVDESPNLNMAFDGDSLMLNWPGNAVGYLQQANALGMPTVWTTVTNAPQNFTNGLSVTLPLSTDQVFYRIGN